MLWTFEVLREPRGVKYLDWECMGGEVNLICQRVKAEKMG